MRSSGAELGLVGATAFAVGAGLVALVGSREKKRLAADVEYVLHRAQTLQQQGGHHSHHHHGPAPASSSSAPGVTVEHLMAALEETGALGGAGRKPAGRRGLANGHHRQEHHVDDYDSEDEEGAGGGGGGLTRKELEETMQKMLMPPGQGLAEGESALDRFTTDLTASARAGKLDPVIGRDEEIRRCVHILSRRTKNNPCLVGESGVGKTAIVEGLAQRIVSGDVPNSLLGCRLLELDLGSLTAGCMMPGEFEERLKAVLTELSNLRGRAILFIDDIHNLVPAMGGQGATMMDGGALLKPALSRGELRCIGASAVDKYKKTVEKDPALERRFQQVFVDQPSVAQTVSILRGLRARYESYHGVGISEGALMAAASLSARYINGRFLPDKAIDLVDEATAQVKMEAAVKPEALDTLERRIGQLEMEEGSLGRKTGDKQAGACLAEVRAQLSVLRAQRDEMTGAIGQEQERFIAMTKAAFEIERMQAQAEGAEEEGDDETAAQLREKAEAMQVELDSARAAALAAAGPGCGFGPTGRMARNEVMEGDVAKVIARWTGIPVTKLVASEREKLLHLTDELHKRIIGQHEAVEAVAEAIQRSRADLADPNGPIASFMFLGPTGVGKTELAKALAAYLFNSEEAMVRLDMSEYMEKHAVSRLIGAPPGYVGYDEGGLLTDAVHRRPYSVVLFDEIEKAHVDVFNVLLQVLDDGRVTDAQGRVVSFKNTVIIMTSNLGSAEIFDQLAKDAEEEAGAGAGAVDPAEAELQRRLVVKEKVMEHVRSHFRPEFVNRVDDFITFEPLRAEQIRRIVVLRAQRLVNRLSEKRMRLQLEESAVEHLAAVGFDPVFGARPVKRALQRELQTLLAQALLRGEFAEEDTIVVRAAAAAGEEEQGEVVVAAPPGGRYRSGLVLVRRPVAAGSAETQPAEAPAASEVPAVSEVPAASEAPAPAAAPAEEPSAAELLAAAVSEETLAAVVAAAAADAEEAAEQGEQQQQEAEEAAPEAAETEAEAGAAGEQGDAQL